MYYDEIALADDPGDINEDVIDPGTASATTTSATTTLATTTSDMTAVAVVQLSEERAGRLKVPDMKDELKKRGKGTGGNKNILFDRLIECIWYKTPVVGKIAERPGCMNGLDITSCWVPFTRNSFPIPDPVNEDSKLCPPTERDLPINPKYGFYEKFDRQPFKRTMYKLG